ncbi:MAG TPA: 2OG-Fe(II) oxygenase family protein [Planctomycetota bacterium]|nr:2OG-Fe(II) oxygenase family protein [Planctomycetota bacterium]
MIPRFELGTTTPREVHDALAHSGTMLIRDTSASARCNQALADAAAFFALPQASKDALDIRRSPHFRGYSTMQNERDWREQIHFGRETGAAGDDPPFLKLEGPNLWPPDAAWRARMLEYLAAVEAMGKRLLALVAESLALPPASFTGATPPYLLMKLICYHAQPDVAAPRQGVAAHLDFSWITLTLQDDTGGLEVMLPDGKWYSVEPRPATWLVNVGELLQFATANTFPATPHRVVNPSTRRSRISIPVFVNPSMGAKVSRLPVREVSASVAPRAHVHRVLAPDRPPTSFDFGEAEWRRKGLNIWCEACVGDGEREPSGA